MLSADDAKSSTLSDDDLVLPFRTVRSDVVGRVIRLGAVVDTVLSRHAYPEPVSHALGEALALTAMLGSALKSEAQAKLILQTKTDGPLDFLVADFVAPGKLRGYANFDKADAGLAEAKGRGDQGALLGKGHVAMTIDRGSDKDRYQGIVSLDREPLVDAAHTYFRQSEQLPTFIRLAVARHYGPARRRRARARRHWRAGGLMIQQLPREGGKREDAVRPARTTTRRTGTAPATSPPPWRTTSCSTRCWRRERLLYRLFHEEGVVVTPAAGLAAECRCSRERIHAYLRQFGAAELEDMREPDGGLTVTCEFCSRKYRFSSADIG